VFAGAFRPDLPITTLPATTDKTAAFKPAQQDFSKKILAT